MGNWVGSALSRSGAKVKIDLWSGGSLQEAEHIYLFIILPKYWGRLFIYLFILLPTRGKGRPK